MTEQTMTPDEVLAVLKRMANQSAYLRRGKSGSCANYREDKAAIEAVAALIAREACLLAALEQYPKRYPQRTQAAKICAGVLSMAKEMAIKTEHENVER